MSTTNNAVLKALRISGETMDVLVAGAASAQGTATKINSLLTRCTKSVASGSFVLPSLLSQEVFQRPYWVVNDTAGAILVYCALGETMNGSANANLSIAAGDSAVFIPVHETASGNNDWRSSVIA
jgi:hypothetical protein